MDTTEEPSDPTLAAAPLLYIGPVNHGNTKGRSIYSVVALSARLADPTYLQGISNATFSNTDIKKFKF